MEKREIKRKAVHHKGHREKMRERRERNPCASGMATSALSCTSESDCDEGSDMRLSRFPIRIGTSAG
jgi:hypothetical protein